MSGFRALALGHYNDWRYHPFTDVDKEIEQVFAGRIEVESTDRYDRLQPASLADYRLFISYTEFVSEKLTPAQTGALLTYVAQGGGLLAIHNGISLQRNPELAGLIGARFTGHPDFTALPVSYRTESAGGGQARGESGGGTEDGRGRSDGDRTGDSAGVHPIVQGLKPFVVDDEPYRFEFSPLAPTTVLAEYEHEGQRWPAAWAHEYGLGRVVYLMPGHRLSAFKVEAYRELILRSGLWAAGLL